MAIFHNYTAFCFQISCMICFIWTAGIILSVMPLSGISSYVSESYLLVCEFNTWSKDSVDRGYIYFLILTAWFMPVCIIFYCYTKVIWMKFTCEKSLEKSLIFSDFSIHLRNKIISEKPPKYKCYLLSPKQSCLPQSFQRRTQLRYIYGGKKISHETTDYRHHLAFGMDTLCYCSTNSTLGIRTPCQ